MLSNSTKVYVDIMESYIPNSKQICGIWWLVFMNSLNQYTKRVAGCPQFYAHQNINSLHISNSGQSQP